MCVFKSNNTIQNRCILIPNPNRDPSERVDGDVDRNSIRWSANRTAEMSG